MSILILSITHSKTFLPISLDASLIVEIKAPFMSVVNQGTIGEIFEAGKLTIIENMSGKGITFGHDNIDYLFHLISHREKREK